MTMNREDISNFSCKIEEIATEKSISYMDAVLWYCEETGFEIEVAAKLISTSLKSKIKMEAEDLHFLPKSETVKLPL